VRTPVSSIDKYKFIFIRHKSLLNPYEGLSKEADFVSEIGYVRGLWLNIFW